VLLAWDTPRRGLVERLRSLGVPVWTLVVVPAGSRLARQADAATNRAEHVQVLESGRIAEGLARLPW